MATTAQEEASSIQQRLLEDNDQLGGESDFIQNPLNQFNSDLDELSKVEPNLTRFLGHRHPNNNDLAEDEDEMMGIESNEQDKTIDKRKDLRINSESNVGDELDLIRIDGAYTSSSALSQNRTCGRESKTQGQIKRVQLTEMKPSIPQY